MKSGIGGCVNLKEPRRQLGGLPEENPLGEEGIGENYHRAKTVAILDVKAMRTNGA